MSGNKASKLTKPELTELTNFLYSRYEHKKKRLNKELSRAIIKEGANRDKSTRHTY